MSDDSRARLFYGYLQPEADRKLYQAIRDAHDFDTDTPWSSIHTKEAHDCVGGLYGYDRHLGFFLAVKASYYQAEWDTVAPLAQDAFTVQTDWNELLRRAAEAFELDVSKMQPGWYLVSLYF